MNYYTSADLYHHGILGMEWGKRNGPPYPLGVSDHSASEKKAGWRKSLDPTSESYKKVKTTGQAIEQHRKNVKSLENTHKNRKVLESYIKHENEIYNKKLSDIEKSERNKEIAKKVLIGVGAVAVSALLAYGVYSMVKKQTLSPAAKEMLQKKWLTSLDRDGKFGSAKLFTSSFKGNEYNTEHLFDKAKWNALSDAERKGVEQYTGSSYAPMNKLLRGLTIPEAVTPLTRDKIDRCTSALEKMKLPEDTLCHRGAGSLSDVAKTFGLKENDLKNPQKLRDLVDTGFSYTDPAFFSSGGATSDAWSGIQLHAFAPKGTKGMYVDPISLHQGEHEILLQRNTTFRIVDYLFDDSTGTVSDLFVEVVEQILQ